MPLTAEDIVAWMANANDNIQTNQAYLTILDQQIGDGDHGINIARGFEKTGAKLKETAYTSVGNVLKDVAMTLMSEVGGASGPLYATAFLRWSTAVGETETVDRQTFAHGLQEAVKGIKERGDATEGDKTLVDVWSEMADFFSGEEVIQADQLTKTAWAAMEASKDRQATKGRASYFKEGSIGYIDPGCASSYFIFAALADVIKEKG